ncbi:DNA polymerase subunit Cdc27 [Phellopilus nigrolimitatus]|nr:DNA polymerase subunit Cdc27 [Phellopilus nigrolimitatus]
MSTTTADDTINAYLQREVVENGNVVTFKLLSRKLAIHVNAAKNALASFHAQKRETSQPVYATFWLSGDVDAREADEAAHDNMDVDGVNETDWQVRKVILVSEQDLENAKATFVKVRSLHVYALSANALTDLSLICVPSQEIREIDAAGGRSFAETVGKILSPYVKGVELTGKPSNPPAPVKLQASSSKLTNVPITKAKVQEKPQVKPVPVASEKERPKTSGKLDWSKAKAKQVKKEPSEAKAAVKVEDAKKAKVDSQEKRGTKRKSNIMIQRREEEEEEEEEEEKETPPVKTKAEPIRSSNSSIPDASNASRLKKRVVISDDEEEIVKPRNYRDPAPPSSPSVGDEEEEEHSTQKDDTTRDEDSDPAPNNGLKKKRIVKSKTDFDEKGYMVTVDYSSYESVDEEEAEAEKEKEAAKPKTKFAIEASAKRRPFGS